MSRLAPTDAQWDAAVRARLAECVPDLVPGGDAVSGIHELTGDVWLVELAGGGRVVAKHQFYGLLARGEAHDLLQVELDALRRLRRGGCPVPCPFGIDPEAQLILLEYAGPRTLAEALRGSPSPTLDRRVRWLARVLDGLARIEGELATEEEVWASRIAPGATRQDLARSWHATAEAAIEGLRAMLDGGSPAATVDRFQALLIELLGVLGAVPPSLGVTDYQPGNIVLDATGERLTFLELGKLGWDWTARRAVQYTTLPNRKGSVGLLDPRSAATGVLDGPGRTALDGHHLIYHLLVARRLDGGPPVPSAPSDSLTRALVTPLSDDPLTGELRNGLRPSPA